MDDESRYLVVYRNILGTLIDKGFESKDDAFAFATRTIGVKAIYKLVARVSNRIEDVES